MDATTRLRTSTLAAWSRALRASHDFDIDAYYAPVTETLMWAAALIDALDRKHDPTFRGLVYARNCAVHGYAIVSEVCEEGPWEARRTKGGPRVGGGSARVRTWAFTDDPKPHDPSEGTRDRSKAQRDDYNERVAHFEVFHLLSWTLRDLGVDVDSIDLLSQA